MIRTYYIPLTQDRHCYFYAQKGDFSEIILSCGQDKMQFAASLPEGLFPSTVSEEEARMGYRVWNWSIYYEPCSVPEYL